MKLTTIGNEKMPSILNDPFKKGKITSIKVEFEPKMFDRDKWQASGWVRFKNGDTSGYQDFKADTFDEVVIKIKQFIESLT